jgi:xylono-1,5-lactonase
MGSAVENICKVAATLGEGPVWIEREQALYFVDIKGPLLFRFDPANGELRSWQSPRQIGWVLPADDGSLLAGLQGGIHRFRPDTGAFDLIAAVEGDRPANRLNDACTDPAGRIWFGTMDDGERAANGSYYLFDRGEVRRTTLPQVAITNGPAVSPDGRVLYHVDTLGGGIYASDIGADGATSGTRLLARVDPADGHPDGPTVDAEGCIWVALFGGAEARRYGPDGSLRGAVTFPVSNITKLAFGGPDLRTAYATTARLHLRPDALARQESAGDLFVFQAPAPGLPVTPAAL